MIWRHVTDKLGFPGLCYMFHQESSPLDLWGEGRYGNYLRAAGPDALSLSHLPYRMQHSARAEVPRHASNSISIYLKAERNFSSSNLSSISLCESESGAALAKC